MAKMKIFELKNLINEQKKGDSIVESKDIQTYLEKNTGVKKTHSSNLEDNEVQMVKDYFLKGNKESAIVKKPSQPAGPGSAKPVGQGVQAGGMHNNTRPAGQSYVGSAGQNQRPAGLGNQSQSVGTGGNQRSVGQGSMNQTGTNTNNQRPIGQGEMRQQQNSNYSTQRPAGQTDMRQGSQGQYNQRPAGQGENRQGGSGQYNQRPQGQGENRQGSGQYGQRPQGQGENRPYNQGQYNQRPQGQGDNRQGSGQYGQRPQGQGDNRQGSGQYGQRPQGQGENRPYNQGQYNQRPQGENRQGSGQYGQRPQGQGENRPYNQGQYNQRPSGQGDNRQGDNRQGSGQYGQRSNYQGQRPAGSGQYGQGGSGQGGQRPYNPDQQRGGQGGYQRPQGGQRPGQDGQRPAGQGYQRPMGQGNQRPGQDGQRTGGYNGQSGYNRPNSGQRPAGGGYQKSYGDFQKDKDDDDKSPSYGNRSGQANKKGGRSFAGGGERKTFDQQVLDQKVAEKNENNSKRSRDRLNKEKTYKERSMSIHDQTDANDEVIKSKIVPKKGQFIKPKAIITQANEDDIKTIVIPEILTIKELADKMKMPSSALVKKLFLAGKMVSINQEITFDEAAEIALEYEIIVEKEVKVNEVEELLKEDDDETSTMEKRPPVVCVMGHVDHGKTSLLDAIRETNVTSREAGGITQHIGAYVVEVNGEKITFLDTPGHEAFTSMRMRGAKSTDIAILVVAADDGVMPQTIEAINHAKAAGVQIIVAINKIDKPSANIERVKQELTEYELVAEDWGGDTIFVPVSAHTKEGIEQLLEMILLTAEIGELKANPNRKARGIVIEAELDKGRGPVATILVQKGTLHVGDNIAIGASYGKVRAMMDDKGRRVKEATPSTPVEILGLNEVPEAGEIFLATDNEKEARTISEAFISQGRERLLADTKAKLSLDGLFTQIKAGNIKELNLVVKADVQGSVEAMKQSLLKLSNEEVAVRIIHGGVGAINESDVILASASNAIIIGFNVRPDNAAKETSERENVDVKLYRVIYNAIDDIEAAMKGLLDPVFEQRIIGHAEIRQTFKASGVGIIAGSYVTDGKIQRGCTARIMRDKTLIYEGPLASLKRFQDDVKEVATGYECGLVFEKFNDVKEGDRVELYIMVEVPR